MKEFFESRRFSGTIALTLSNKQKWYKDKAVLCKEIVEVVNRYSRSGYVLTLRQLYYQLVSINSIRNDDVVYKKLSAILDDLRQAGIIDWDSIEDRGRIPKIPYNVEGIEDALEDAIKHYRLDRQADQDEMIEVWTEKDAISGILYRVTSKYHVRLVVNKGYSSNSAMYAAYKRFVSHLAVGENVTILYFGDHDPSGLDMIRDIRERTLHFLASSEHADDYLPQCDDPDWGFIDKYIADNDIDYYELINDGFMEDKSYQYADGDEDKYVQYIDDLHKAARKHYWNTRFKVVPIGLTMDQIKQYDPPENPAKLTDPRAAWYIKQFGHKSWEVDALNPQIMVDLVEKAIESRIDMEAYENILKKEKEDVELLKNFIKKLK